VTPGALALGTHFTADTVAVFTRHPFLDKLRDPFPVGVVTFVNTFLCQPLAPAIALAAQALFQSGTIAVGAGPGALDTVAAVNRAIAGTANAGVFSRSETLWAQGITTRHKAVSRADGRTATQHNRHQSQAEQCGKSDQSRITFCCILLATSGNPPDLMLISYHIPSTSRLQFVTLTWSTPLYIYSATGQSREGEDCPRNHTESFSGGNFFDFYQTQQVPPRPPSKNF
jgi:hypothetical protein